MAVLSLQQQKLAKLCSMVNVAKPEDLIEPSTRNGLSPGICMNERCNNAAELAPSETRGSCRRCGTKSMKSALVLACLI